LLERVRDGNHRVDIPRVIDAGRHLSCGTHGLAVISRNRNDKKTVNLLA
jgi:hypothetical protein